MRANWPTRLGYLESISAQTRGQPSPDNLRQVLRDSNLVHKSRRKGRRRFFTERLTSCENGNSPTGAVRPANLIRCAHVNSFCVACDDRAWGRFSLPMCYTQEDLALRLIYIKSKPVTYLTKAVTDDRWRVG